MTELLQIAKPKEINEVSTEFHLEDLLADDSTKWIIMVSITGEKKNNLWYKIYGFQHESDQYDSVAELCRRIENITKKTGKIPSNWTLVKEFGF